jgi:TatD DNase family protein
MLIDSHCHLDRDEYGDDREAVIARARAAGLQRAVLIGLWRAPGSFGDALALRDTDPAFFAATIGIHPHEAAEAPESDYLEMERLAHDPRVVGVGETGLDYHYNHSPPDVQQQAFRRHIRAARSAGKPVVVHVREAHDDCRRILVEEQAAAGGIIHCFTGSAVEAEGYLALGFFISVAGVVTFKAADGLREAVRKVPIDRLLIETDSPFLTPIPFRGKRNEPAHVALVAARVAEVKGLTVDEVARATTANARRAFSL